MTTHHDRVEPAAQDLPHDVAMRNLSREIGAGGFSSTDGSVEFYSRVNSLLSENMALLDFGAGRGKDATDDPVAFRRGLRILTGKVRLVVGADIDTVVRLNPSVDCAVQIEESGRLPFRSDSFDLILSDHTFEHLRTPHSVMSELDRVLKHGGWICARTPNRRGYIALGARLVPNRFHTLALEFLQPSRKREDVFPTVYALNTPTQLNAHLPAERYRDCSYYYNPDPAYFGESIWLNRIANLIFKLLPRRWSAVLMVFRQKV